MAGSHSSPQHTPEKSYGSGDRAVAVPAERGVQTVISIANAGHIPLDTVQGCFALQLEATAHHE